MRTPLMLLSLAVFCSVTLAQTTTAPAANKSDPAITKIPAPQAPATQSNTLGLTVAKAVICKNFDENGIADEGVSFPTDVKRLYCVTQIKGAKDTVQIQHRWFNGDNPIFTITLPLKSINWRTQSYINVHPTTVEDWRVDVVAMPKEEVLTTLKFTVK